MKNSTATRKRIRLTLARETVRTLTAQQLEQVQAGMRRVDTCDMGTGSCKPTVLGL